MLGFEHRRRRISQQDLDQFAVGRMVLDDEYPKGRLHGFAQQFGRVLIPLLQQSSCSTTFCSRATLDVPLYGTAFLGIWKAAYSGAMGRSRHPPSTD